MEISDQPLGPEPGLVDVDPGVQHKCVITGTGRSGTTFLVQLFSELGLDTGFTSSEIQKRYFSQAANAGLEINPLRAEVTPYLIKDPKFSSYIEDVINSKKFILDHVIIPVRSLEEAAMSRVHVSQRTGGKVGGLWKTRHPHLQKALLAETFYHLIYTLVLHDVPYTLIEFPRMVKDSAYTYRALSFLTSVIGEKQFHEAFDKVARPQEVHSWTREEISTLLAKPRLIMRVILHFSDRISKRRSK